jgi:hypothetical protein
MMEPSKRLEEKYVANPPSWRANYQCFLHWQDIGWSRSYVPVSRWSCELWRTTKHTIVYSGTNPFCQVIALRPTFLCIKDEQCYNRGELRALRSSLSERRKYSCVPCLKGRKSFIAEMRLDNYKLGCSRWLEASCRSAVAWRWPTVVEASHEGVRQDELEAKQLDARGRGTHRHWVEVAAVISSLGEGGRSLTPQRSQDDAQGQGAAMAKRNRPEAWERGSSPVNQRRRWRCSTSAHDGEKEGGKWRKATGNRVLIAGAMRQWGHVARMRPAAPDRRLAANHWARARVVRAGWEMGLAHYPFKFEFFFFGWNLEIDKTLIPELQNFQHFVVWQIK